MTPRGDTTGLGWHNLTCSDDFNSYNNPEQIKSELLTMCEREEEEREQRIKKFKPKKGTNFSESSVT